MPSYLPRSTILKYVVAESEIDVGCRRSPSNFARASASDGERSACGSQCELWEIRHRRANVRIFRHPLRNLGMSKRVFGESGGARLTQTLPVATPLLGWDTERLLYQVSKISSGLKNSFESNRSSLVSEHPGGEEADSSPPHFPASGTGVSSESAVQV